MNLNYELLTPDKISAGVLHFKELDRGLDSVVYSCGQLVIKRYFNQPFELIKDYQSATNLLSKIFNDSALSINPISEVIESSTDYSVFAISKFIPGGNLDSLLKQKRINQAEFLNYKTKLFELSQEMAKTYLVNGINIIPYNTSLIFEARKTHLLVTDLCPNLKKFRFN